MVAVPSRDLRNRTADVLGRVARGDTVTITVNGTPVADLVPPQARRSAFLSRSDVATLLRRQADAGLTTQLEELVGNTTDDLDPLR